MLTNLIVLHMYTGIKQVKGWFMVGAKFLTGGVKVYR